MRGRGISRPVLEEDDPAPVRREEAEKHAHERRLAAAVRAEDRRALARADLEDGLLDDRPPSERHAHALEARADAHGAPRPSRNARASKRSMAA